MAEKEPKERDWVELLAGLAGALGMNKVRVRWKLERLRRRREERGRERENRWRNLGYQHKVCPRCARINDRAEKVCGGCGAPLAGRPWELLRRVGLRAPVVQSVSAVLGILILLVYARLILAEWPRPGIFAFQVGTLYLHGGHYPPAVLAGQYWRWLTAIFLHAGVWHLGFNLFALSQVGPAVEQIFGRGRSLLLFVVTGVVANIGSFVWGLYGVGIGASGAIMGLCGLAAGWGQREGTAVGRAARNMMGKWALYTVVFGYFIGADNAAHVVGFISGGLLGLVLRPKGGDEAPRVWLEVTEAVVGGLAVLLGVGLCLWTPGSP